MSKELLSKVANCILDDKLADAQKIMTTVTSSKIKDKLNSIVSPLEKKIVNNIK